MFLKIRISKIIPSFFIVKEGEVFRISFINSIPPLMP